MLAPHQQGREQLRDLSNLYESTQVAIVFLHRDLTIRSFTPVATEVFSLIASDKGRPLTDIASQLDYDGLLADARTVLGTGDTVERRVARRDGSARYLLRVIPYQRGKGIDGLLITLVEVTDLTAADAAHAKLLVEELNHRVRNMLAVVVSVATETLDRSTDIEVFRTAFLNRINAMAGAFALVTRENWGDVQLNELLKEELAPFGGDGDGRIRMDGPAVRLRPKAALSLGMVIHELAMNAAKYGSLSDRRGWLQVSWRVEEGAEGNLVVDWLERGGPAPALAPPGGFGSRLITQLMAYELRGKADLTYPADGAEVRLRAPFTDRLGSLGERSDSP